MTHKGGQALTEDEVLSPSFEDAIVLWALEKIDPRLPKKVRKDYEHRLTGNIYLIDLQVTIFQSIPSMLEDLNRQADLQALTIKDPSLSAVRYNGKNLPRGGGGGRGLLDRRLIVVCSLGKLLVLDSVLDLRPTYGIGVTARDVSIDSPELIET